MLRSSGRLGDGVGLFDLTELSEATVFGGTLMGVERDLYWTPETLRNIRQARTWE